MPSATIIGLDTAKNVFQVHGVDTKGNVVLRKRLRRGQLTDFFANVPRCVIGLEATQGAHYWARVLETFGHAVRLVAPQFVKPYLKSQKNDLNDAAAICEAVSRPQMRFVPQKTVEQQDMQALHRVRSRLIASRTQIGNQIRGLLAEYGIVLPQHLSHVRQALPQLTEVSETRLSGFAKRLFAALYEELCALDQRIEVIEAELNRAFQQNALCQRISAVEGIGPVTATAVIAAISNGSTFSNGGSSRLGSGSFPGSTQLDRRATTIWRDISGNEPIIAPQGCNAQEIVSCEITATQQIQMTVGHEASQSQKAILGMCQDQHLTDGRSDRIKLTLRLR
jgi:transposase